jgi:hypothetical protein
LRIALEGGVAEASELGVGFARLLLSEEHLRAQQPQHGLVGKARERLVEHLPRGLGVVARREELDEREDRPGGLRARHDEGA